MRFNKLFRLALPGLVAGIIAAFGATDAAAQVDEVSSTRTKAKTVIRPKAKPAPRRVDYNRRVTITRVQKKRRKTKTVAKRVVVPLLATQFRLLTVDKDGVETEVNPLAVFTPRDRLRLSIKTNQKGFLYIIRQLEPEGPGEIIFPTTLVNNGSNYVAPNVEYVIPRNCPADYVPNQRDCALQLAPFADAPQEYFTLIFTRDSLVDLPDDVKNTRVSLANLMSAGKIESKTLIDLIEDSGQDLISQQGDTPYAIRIVNVNPKDNEEIIETFVLSKLK